MFNSNKTNILGLTLFFGGLIGTFYDLYSGAVFLIKSDLIVIPFSLVYIILLSLGLAILLFVLIPKFFEFIKNQKIEPDTSIKEALDYIKEVSNFGKSLPDNQHGRDDAVKALKSLLVSGHLKLFATSQKKPLLHEIKLKEFEEKNLHILYLETDDYDPKLISVAYISKSEVDKEVKFNNFSVSRKQLRKIFSSRY
jgi:hypothetical protein